jgi:hypothetical protein
MADHQRALKSCCTNSTSHRIKHRACTIIQLHRNPTHPTLSFISFTHVHSGHTTHNAHRYSITALCACTASVVHIAHPLIAICTSIIAAAQIAHPHTFHSHCTIAQPRMVSLSFKALLQHKSTIRGCTSQITSSAAQIQRKSPGRHCSRRSITTTHVAALTNHPNHYYCSTIASPHIISSHKEKHFAQRTFHAQCMCNRR